jgi:hypothetical protein
MRDLLCRIGRLGLRQRTSSGQNAALGRYAVGPIPPTCCEAGRITKWVGFHTFRHTYSTLLKANGKDVKVVQELMRHANISTTMNIYTKALTQPSGRLKAGWSTFFWVDRGKPRRVQHENQRIESVASFLRIREVVGLIGGPDRDRTDDLFHAIRDNIC